MSYEERLLAELEFFRECVSDLTVLIEKIAGIVNEEAEKRKEEKEAIDVVWRFIDMPYKLRRRLELAGIDSVKKLTGYSRAGLKALRIGLTDEMLRRIAMALARLDLHLKGEKVYEVSDEVRESPDIAHDNAMITEVLAELGYPEFDLFDNGQKWAFEAIRFAMNNPKPSREYRTYLWPVIAGRDGVSVAEVTKAVGDSVKRMCPDLKVRFTFELRNIGLSALEKRKLADMERQKENVLRIALEKFGQE